MSQVELDAQMELWEAFKAGDFERFNNAIDLDGQLNLIADDDIYSMSVYETVLSTSGSAKFIKACIEAGCDVNYVSK